MNNVARSEIVRVGDLNMSMTQVGTGQDVVLVAGLADGVESWDAQLVDFSRSYRVTAFDNRGVGGTRAPTGQLSVKQMVADLTGLMDALDIDSAHLVGSSMGGAIVQEVALAAPHRVTTATLFGTWCRVDGVLRAAITGMMDARKAMDKKAFWGLVFAWCLSPATYVANDVEMWVRAAAEATGGADRRRVRVAGRGSARLRQRRSPGGNVGPDTCDVG